MAIVGNPTVGDVGVKFQATIRNFQTGKIVPLNTATTFEFIFTKPDKTIVTKTAVLTNGGSDGLMHYITVTNDLDQDGQWTIHANLVIPSGFNGESNKKNFFVVKD